MTEIRTRPARPDDRDTVLAFCARTWEFGDYIDRVWDRWLTDPRSDLIVAVDAADRPVGLAHARLVAPAEGWLEGLRVDPERRRRGIGAHLGEAAAAAAEARGARAVRFATLTTNTPVHHFAPQIGFRRLTGFGIWRADPDPAGSPTRPVDWPPDRVTAIAAGKDSVTALAGLIVAGWSYARLDAARLADWLAEGAGEIHAGAGTPAGAAPALAWVERNDAEHPLSIAWVAADLAELSELGRALRSLAHSLGRPAAEVRLPLAPDLAGALAAAGFEHRPDADFFIYERSADRAGRAELRPVEEDS